MKPANAKRVAVVLSGCGVHDGTEVHEATLALLALERQGFRPNGGARGEVVFTAPNVAQHHVVNHLTGTEQSFETRSAMVESARIARGPVRDLATLDPATVHAAVFPGGFGAVKTWCDYALRARSATVIPAVERFVRGMHDHAKPMAFVCSSAVIAARVLGREKLTLTAGHDASVAADLEAWGAVHQACSAREIVVDREHKVVSTPAFQCDAGLVDIAEGIDRAVRAMLEMT